MKKIALIFGMISLTYTLNAENTNIVTEKPYEYVNKHIKLNEASTMTIKDQNGNVVFYSEGIKNLNVENWMSGTYEVNINNKTKFEITIIQNLMAYNLKK